VLIIEAIKRAVRKAFTRQQTDADAPANPEPMPTPKPTPKSEQEPRVREAKNDDETDAGVAPESTMNQELKAVLLSQFGSAQAAFSVFSNNGTISKKEWKRMIRKLLPHIAIGDARLLKKTLPKKVSLVQFCELMGEVKPKKRKQASASKISSQASPHLAELPCDVPVLPTSFKPRPHAHEQLVAALLDSSGSCSTAVTAPKSRVSSQGMGGVGKTMLTCAVVRDERVRGAFESIAWIGMSQQPELLQLQSKLYQQLHPRNKKMPSKADSMEAMLRELSKLASKRTVLLVLDDICK
jgi:hypothetical protein